jgi:antitoxin (DNA-binding transcriptional repressor) of toxin-antitoxin stability system
METPTQVTAREVVHAFAHYAELAERGTEVLIKRRGKPSLKLVRAEPASAMTTAQKEAAIKKALSFRAIRPYGKKFERSDAYDE